MLILWPSWSLVTVFVVTLLAAVAYLHFHHRRMASRMQLMVVSQKRGMKMLAWIIEKTFEHADGIVSVEFVVSDMHSREASVAVHRPTVNAETGSIEDFIRLNYTPGTAFRVEEARIEVRQGGQLHVLRFSNKHLTTLLSTALFALKSLDEDPKLEDITYSHLPTRATLLWVDTGLSHDVTPAVTSLAGPKSQWLNNSGLTVSTRAVMAESLRHLYCLKASGRILKHLKPCQLRIEFLLRKQPIVLTPEDVSASDNFFELINE